MITLLNTMVLPVLETRTIGTEYILSLSGFPAGVYTLQVSGEAGTAFSKLVME